MAEQSSPLGVFLSEQDAQKLQEGIKSISSVISRQRSGNASGM